MCVRSKSELYLSLLFIYPVELNQLFSSSSSEFLFIKFDKKDQILRIRVCRLDSIPYFWKRATTIQKHWYNTTYPQQFFPT